MKLDRQDSLTYVPLLFQSLDGLLVLEADDVEPDDCPALFISPWSSLKFGIQSLSPVALTNRPRARHKNGLDC